MPSGDHFLAGGQAPSDSQLARASAEPPAMIETLVHHLIDKRCEEQPEAPAVCAWNGNFTYRQLGILARSFGTLLAANGVGPEVFVPVYCEKSRWTIVAMLGVLHAGGAFVLLDPSHPIQRLEWICQTVNARLIVATSQNASKAARLAHNVVIVDDERPMDRSPKATHHPDMYNAAYVIFTSGSTGTPKGAVIEHRCISSSTVAHGSKVNLNRQSRALQFASYAFDACLLEILTVLVHGGCVCVLSEVERRSDLVGAMNRLRINWASITPSMARTLEPDSLPTLQTVVLIGEAVTKDDIKQWTSHVRLFNGYGPTECTILACTHAFSVTPDSAIKIGHPVGGSCWIVDENDIETISEIGQIGELLIEGPIVGRGYIGDPIKTAAAFIDRPKWLRKKWPDAHGKVYRTGDLARCYPDGTIECLGRKDSQMKIHGQRMEAAEIEHHMRQHLANMDLAVEVVKPKDDPESPVLAAFVVPEPRAGVDPQDVNLEAEVPNKDFTALARRVRGRLLDVLPSYMVPLTFLKLPYLPLGISGKLDRRILQQLGNSKTRRELQKLGCERTVIVPPRNRMEESIQSLWAEVLQLPSESIGAEDNFWALGGSSIRAMKLAGVARGKGLTLKMEDIWGAGTLEQMAAQASVDGVSTEQVAPFALCGGPSSFAELMAILTQYKIREDDVEDIYPCTRLQEGLFSLAAKRKGRYTVAMEFELPVDIELGRFRRAWQTTVETNPILRTRIVPGPDSGLWQAVIRDSIPWDVRNPGEEIPTHWKDWRLGQRLIRLALSNTRSPKAPPLFTLVLHHALTDGWAVQLVLQQVETAYRGGILTPRPFSPFLKYLASEDQGEVEHHWRESLANLSAEVFPRMPSPDYIPTPTRSTTSSIMVNPGTDIGHTALSAQLKLAWGILISHYTHSWDVVFGATVAGRGAPVQGIESMTGPTIATVPTRMLLDPQETVINSLRSIQKDALRNMAAEQAGLQRISRLSVDSAAACQFQSLLIIQPDESENQHLSLFSERHDISQQTDFSSYGITLIVKPSSTTVELSITYDPLMVAEVQMTRLVDQYKHVYRQLQQAPDAPLKEISCLSPSDMSELQRWNGQAPKQVAQCAHELIYQRTLSQPGAPAVSAWDGAFSYQELEMHSENLARRLALHEVGPETLVPVYFEKSRWTTVAMLGVLKAGGAFVLLDPSHPIDRLRNICHQAQSAVAVCSEAKAPVTRQLGLSETVVLGPSHTEMLGTGKTRQASRTTPENAMYAVFTSGSTGHPKGAVMKHGNWCTSAQANYARMRLSTQSRVLQFSAYAFDVSITDNLLTLVAGGCVCVPSEQDRMSNLTGAIAALRANWAAMTPSVARLLNPKTSPTLNHLILCGESMKPADVVQWSAHLHLMNLYGPAECAMLVTMQDNVLDAKNIGSVRGGVGWVVDPRDSGRLCPIGAVGELLVEGPIIAQGYLREPQKTAEVFIESPPWLHGFRGSTSRLYKTGDLVQYTANGELEIVGRKDTQIKLHGQRVEVGEVEHHLRLCFPGAQSVVIDLLPAQDGRDSLLVGFVLCTPMKDQDKLIADSDASFRRKAETAFSGLNQALPSYMVPAVLIPLNRLPLSVTGKLNLRDLRSEVALLSHEQLQKFRMGIETVVREPETHPQSELRRLFAEVLSIPEGQIGIEDNFFRRGGDSLSAMKLVALARKLGWDLTVGDVFSSPRIVDLAAVKSVAYGTSSGDIPPFNLVSDSKVLDQIITGVMAQGHIARDEIEDVYPCTSMQEGLMALSLKTPGKYVAKLVYDLEEGIDLVRLRTAIDSTVFANPILRTRLTQTSEGSFQVVMRETAEWRVHDTPQACEKALMQLPDMGPNQRLLRLNLLTSPPRLFINIHHALYDGWSISLLWNQIEAAYHGEHLHMRPFAPFIGFAQQREDSKSFWRAQLEELEVGVFPTLPSGTYQPKPDHAIQRQLLTPPCLQTGITMPTAIQLAWALIMSYYTDSNDVVFGLTLSGRNAPVAGIDQFSGPTLAAVPLRTRLQLDQSIGQAMLDINAQLAAMMPHEQTGLREIRTISDDAAKACDFQSQLVIQPPGIGKGGRLATEVQEHWTDYSNFASYGIVMACNLAVEGQPLEIVAQYDPNMLSPTQAHRLVVQFEHVLLQILNNPDLPIRSISPVSEEDWTQLKVWNGTLPTASEHCLHDLVSKQSYLRPDAPAISAWDGELTFRELHDLSHHFALFLKSKGLEQKSIVPFCMERSKWSVVSMLAVLRSGGTLVCIDPTLPAKRLESILEQVHPQLVIASRETKHKFEGFSATVLTAPLETQSPNAKPMSTPEPPVDPSTPAFIVFTSGSTGKPKGIVMEHRTMSTGIQAHYETFNISQSSRVLHFGSYSFDASLYEVFTTLTTGACLCIPSESDRINALERFIEVKQVNVLMLATSVLSMLDPDQVPSIKAVAVGGEPLTRQTASRWASQVPLVNGYGPAETTLCCAAGRVEADWKPGTIGPMRGAVAWVTVPSDPQRLVPLGAIGELLIEGPIVTSGYLNRSYLANTGFIDAPDWLIRWRNGKPGRLFQTGDLVELDNQGSIRFIGRKDTQVKLRGQRIELAEVESNISRCLKGQGVVADIAAVSGSSILFACVDHGLPQEISEENGLFLPATQSFRDVIQAAETTLRDAVPVYMLPTVFLPISKAPRTAGGKIDRRLLRNAVGGLSPADMQAYTAGDRRQIRPPSNAREMAIRATWGRVLKKDPEEISMDNSFFHLGGDSISAMRMISQLRNVGISITVQDVFKLSTIAKLAQTIEESNIISSYPTGKAAADVSCGLSPVQRLFLVRSKGEIDHVNHGFLLELQRPVSSDKLREAVKWLVETHDMLRARFSRDSRGEWHQKLTTDVDTSYHYHAYQGISDAEAEDIFKSHQRTLRVGDGPLLAVDLMNMVTGKQSLSFIVHRLVADRRSLHIIMGQLQQRLESPHMPPKTSMSYFTWCRLLEEHIATNVKAGGPTCEYPTKDYWGLTDASNVYADAAEYTIALDDQSTAILMGQANRAFQTRPEEIVQAALVSAFIETFPDRCTPVFFTEDDGRNPWKEGIDVSATVGALSNIYPCHVQVKEDDSLVEIVRRTKDSQRDAQRQGLYFTATEQSERIDMEVLWHYFDASQPSGGSDTMLKRAHMPTSSLVTKGSKVGRLAPIEILAEVIDSQLLVTFSYAKCMKKSPAVVEWANRSLEALSSLTLQLPTLSHRLTRSDLPLLRLTDDNFEHFRVHTADPFTRAGHVVLDAYPCSPIQQGMLLSQAKNVHDYVNKMVWCVHSRHGKSIDAGRLVHAWQKVVQKHSILRTVFIDSPRGDGGMDQAVLDSVPPEIVSLVSTESDNPLTELSRYHKPNFPVLCPPHRMTVCQSVTGAVACSWDVHHALVDGITCDILLRNLLQAYDDILPPLPDHVYRAYISHLQRQCATSSRDYWDQYTDGLNPCFFPYLGTDGKHNPDTPPGHLVRSLACVPVLRGFCQKHQLTLATVFQVAWGLVLRAYTRSDDVCYGYMTSGRDAPIRGIEDAAGPFINLLVRRVDFREEISTIAALYKSQEDFMRCLPYQYWPLAEIMHRHQGVLFNSVMSVQSDMTDLLVPDSTLSFEHQGGDNATEYDLGLHIQTSQNHVSVLLDYNQNILGESHAAFVIDAFEQAVNGIVSHGEHRLRSMPLLGGDSLRMVQGWNRGVPEAINRCIGDMILDNCRRNPDAPAVCAWDGNFTYAELDARSRSLSNRLRSHFDVGPEQFVPIYAVKSRWVAVAMTAVIRSGGAFILLDPSHPLERLHAICTQSRATMVLAPLEDRETATRLMRQVVTYGEEYLQEEDNENESGSTAAARQLTPDNALYAVFTSGSTGQPKGVIIPHRALATSAVRQAGTLRIGPQSRVLQFASFAFDAAISEILMTLIQRGCVCIPSEKQRQQELPRAACELGANWACLTPSVARTLHPTDFPTLRTLVLVGEAVASKEVQVWSPTVDLIVGYGPAECAVACIGTGIRCQSGTEEAILGRSFGCRVWIVDPEDPDVLAPLGATGEIIIDGPIVGRGYLNDPLTTQAAFLDGPRKWGTTVSGRVYKTGDLARYQVDGTLQYVARKDLQVKLRGQRFELAEVEHHLRQVFNDSNDAIAEVVDTGNETKILVAFISSPTPHSSNEAKSDDLLGPATRSFRTACDAAGTKLRTRMPEYMVPTLFLPLNRVPLTNNGKLDRRQLRDAVIRLSMEEIQAYSSPTTSRTQPSSPEERRLQQIWSEVLVRPLESIGVEDNFFRLGGDSLRAMTLIPRAREAGHRITMVDVFNNPTIRDLVKAARAIADEPVAILEPFALIPDSTDLIKIAAKCCGISPRHIEDIYPCTALQEGLMALSTKSADRYKVTFRYILDYGVDLDLFQSAWTAVAAVNPILRTRIIQPDSHPGTFQVVAIDSPEFQAFDDQETCEGHIRASQMTPGKQLADFSLVYPRHAGNAQFYLTLHHSIYDGVTIASLWNQCQTYYQQPQIPLGARPFNRFIEYVQRQHEGAAGYWRSEFSGLSAPAWPSLPSPRHAPVANAALHHTITDLDLDVGSEYTTTTFIHLAWGLTMSSHTDSDDLVFGVTLNGRSAPLAGIEDMTGPTIATFPLRIRLGLASDTVEGALSTIQRQGAERIPFQQFGLQNIRNTTTEASHACQFQSHLGIQSDSSSSQNVAGLCQALQDGQNDYARFAEYAIVVVCHLDDSDTSSIHVVVNYDPQVVSAIAVSRILGQFAHLIKQLPKSLERPLNQLDMISPGDQHQLSAWNSQLPSPFEVCLHELVITHAAKTPESAAISAWDGDLSYAQLIAVSGQIARQLRLLGVRRGTLVPLCFDRSKWAPITMLAVLQAGGACVPLDPSHPAHHIEAIIRRVDAKVVLTSHRTRQLIPAGCGAKVATIPLQGLAAHAAAASWTAPSCHDIAFVIFTSGSTGEPKGILMEHLNLCTSIRDHSPPMLISKSTRALHFASYAFDASIYELFTMLANGACVCIPSDSDRLSNLAGFICNARVNYAIFTPSILNRLLRPEMVPGLEIVSFGGEGVTQDVVDTWSPHVILTNGYGPAEATICAVGPIHPGSWTVGTIGPVTGGVGWVTMPSDVSRLAPVGAVGELVIEGPVVTRGYLNDADRTAAAYISPPCWLTQFRREQKPGRLYRTGDLVQYTDNGGIRFVGRKDNQIKLRGQRVELSHVEHHVRLCFRDAAEIVAEIVYRKGNPTLVMFIAQTVADNLECTDLHDTTDGNSSDNLFLRPSASFRAQVQSTLARLKTSLPGYMIPALFLHLAQVPRTASGKLDRRQMRDQATDLSTEHLQAFSTHSGESSTTFHPPITAREIVFQQLWGQVLDIPADSIGARDDFFELGGDSIMAMKLTSHLRQHGLSLNVSDIFAWPVLQEQASGAKECTDKTHVEPYHPGSLLDIKDFTAFAVRELGCSSSPASRQFQGMEIEDILPVTEFQRRFLEYHQLYYFQLQLPIEIDIVRLEKACQAVVDRHPMLRSTFVPYRDTYLQIQFRHIDIELRQISCKEDLAPTVERLCVDDAAKGVAWGRPYLQTSLVSRAPSESVLLLRASHAQLDGESLPLFMQDLIAVYEGASLEKAPPSFGLYLRDRQTQANSQTYGFWEQYLQGAAMTRLVLSGSDSDEYFTRRQHISLPTPPRGITLSSLVKAAWAIVLAQVTGQRDLVFGHVLNGRDTPVAGIHAMSGPCVTVSPIRITIPSSQQVLDLLRHVQTQYTRALPYAGIDFEAIRQHSTPWPASTYFSCAQTHQNGAYTPSFTVQGHDCPFDWRIIGGAPEFHVVTLPLPDQLIVHLGISSRLGSQSDIDGLSDRFCAAIGDLGRGLFPSLSA